MDEEASKVSRIDSNKEIHFLDAGGKYNIIFNLTLAGSEFPRVSAATKIAQVPAFNRFHLRNVKSVITTG